MVKVAKIHDFPPKFFMDYHFTVLQVPNLHHPVAKSTQIRSRWQPLTPSVACHPASS